MRRRRPAIDGCCWPCSWVRRHSGAGRGGLGPAARRCVARGRQAYDRGDWEEADRLARQRLKAAANDPEGLRLLARASIQLGRDDLAMSLYQRLGESAMQAEDRYLLGLVLSRSGKLRSAVTVWEAARRASRSAPRRSSSSIRGYLRLDRMDRGGPGRRAAGRTARLGGAGRGAAGHDRARASTTPAGPRRNGRAPWIAARTCGRRACPAWSCRARSWPGPGCASGGRPRRGTSSAPSWPRARIPRRPGS